MEFTQTTIYQKAFNQYLRRGTPIDVSIRALLAIKAETALQHTTPQYIWRTQGDDKVRPSHAANEGKIFAWDNPPATGNPGDEYGCRCTAEPYYGIYDPPIEPVYPELVLLSFLPAGRLLSALRGFMRTVQFKPGLRQQYVSEVKNLSRLENNLRAQGKTPEEIARTLSRARRDLGEKYKDLTPENLRQRIYDRNMARYGDKLGPTPEYLRNQGKTWEEIIESAKRPDGSDLF